MIVKVLSCACPACKAGKKRKEILRREWRKLRHKGKEALHSGKEPPAFLAAGYTD